MTPYDHSEYDHHEMIAFKEDQASGLRAIIAIHNTQLGPAVGGCRMFAYPCSEAALGDVLRLSKGMTYKAALADLAFGGGKSVIIGDPHIHKSRELLLAMADFINELGGKYLTAEDSGTSVADMQIMAERTQYVSGIPRFAATADDGDPSPVTAYGVFCGIQAAVQYRLHADLRDVRVAVQGVGNVGFHLASLLVAAGAQVRVADINLDNTRRAADELGVEVVNPDSVLYEDVDVIAPCAMGAAINDASVECIQAAVVAGSANNQLATQEMGEALMQRGILYAPDYVINAGGVIDVYYQLRGVRDREIIDSHVARIGETLTAIFYRSANLHCATNVIADRMAEEIFMGAGKGVKVA